MQFELELIATTVDMCKMAKQAGATRIELCTGLCEGGTTPSEGLIRGALRNAGIPVYVMIRPRGGDFFYSDMEFETMLEDVVRCKQLGADGIVTGILNKDGSIDKKRNLKMVERAFPLGVTFHRAFDRALNPEQTVKDILDCGFERILSSGQMPTVVEGQNLIKDLVQKFGNEIIIMPGSGINEKNIEEIARTTGATQFHLSAKKSIPSQMDYYNPSMRETGENPTIDFEMISLVAKKLAAL